MKNIGHLGMAAALVMVLGCGGGKEEQQLTAAKHYVAVYYANNVTAQYYGEFRTAVNNADSAAAQAAFTKFKEALTKARNDFKALPASNSQAAKEAGAASQALLDTYEKVAVPEMTAIVKQLETGKPDNQVIKEAIGKTNEAVLKQFDAAAEAAKKLQAESTAK